MINIDHLTVKAALITTDNVPARYEKAKKFGRIIPESFLDRVVASLKKNNVNEWDVLNKVPRIVLLHERQLELNYIGVPTPLRGKGYAKLLLQGFAAYMKRNNLSFAISYSENAPFWKAVAQQYQDIIRVEFKQPRLNGEGDLVLRLP